MAKGIFATEQIIGELIEAKVPIQNWRKQYNKIRPHTSLDYRPPEPEAFQPVLEPAILTLWLAH